MTTLTLLDALPRHPLDPSTDGLLLAVAIVTAAIGVLAAVAIALQARVGVAAPATRSEHGLPIDSWGRSSGSERLHVRS